MHRRIIMTHNLVAEFNQKLTHSKIGTQNAFETDSLPKMAMWVSIAPALHEASRLILSVSDFYMAISYGGSMKG